MHILRDKAGDSPNTENVCCSQGDVWGDSSLLLFKLYPHSGREPCHDPCLVSQASGVHYFFFNSKILSPINASIGPPKVKIWTIITAVFYENRILMVRTQAHCTHTH